MAVYLASYFDINKSSKSYFKQHKDDIYFKKYFEEDFSKEVFTSEIENFRQKLRKDFNLFKECCCKTNNGDLKKMQKMLSVRKFFSVPWLICGESLLN